MRSRAAAICFSRVARAFEITELRFEHFAIMLRIQSLSGANVRCDWLRYTVRGDCLNRQILSGRLIHSIAARIKPRTNAWREYSH